MSSEYIILHDSPHTETLAWESPVEAPVRQLTLALAKPETTYPDSGFLTPNAVKSLIDQQVKVFVQYGFSNHNPFSDTDYADVGAEFTHRYADIALLSSLILKFDAFTFEQIALAKERQLLCSILAPENVTPEYIEAVNAKKITMICLEMIQNDTGESVLERIRKETLSEAGFQIALSNFILPTVGALVHAPGIAYALQHAPELLQAVFCHAGFLCHEPTAEKLHHPWRDILSLCWGLN